MEAKYRGQGDNEKKSGATLVPQVIGKSLPRRACRLLLTPNEC